MELGIDDPTNWLFLAMAQWKLDDKDRAREWHDKSVAWRDKNKPDDELESFYAEAAKLLGVDNSDKKDDASRE